MARTLDELQDRNDPGINLIREWLAQVDGNAAEILAPERALADATLLQLQVTTRSLLGAVVYETGGVIVDDGLLRILGSGTERSLLESNRSAGFITGKEDNGGVLLIADDVMGGLFALNGGGFGSGNPGEVFHLAADDLAWAPLEVGYSDFLEWCLTGDLAMLYKPLAAFDAYKRRPRPPINRSYSFYPFLWTKEGREGAHDVQVIAADESVQVRLELIRPLSNPST
ncbi:MAG: DUF2625 domain-containing protein [Alphaproteobacteria bacterium]|nr:DUF2625 domain-containing protein [Alphaproteobacteria bacterium]